MRCKSVRQSRRAGQAAGRLSAAAADLEVCPSESESERRTGQAGCRAHQQQQQVWKSIHPSRRAGRLEARGRLSLAAATNLEVRPSRSESSGWLGRGPAECSSSRSGIPSVRLGVVEPAGPRRGQQPEVSPSLRRRKPLSNENHLAGCQ
jgi:hypothetical protein